MSWPHRIWSGRRGSNPRPTAWKAVTLPLSYSRVPIADRGARKADWVSQSTPVNQSALPQSVLRNSTIPFGGEGRTRTFEAARATDLQSAAFDRFATSPAVCMLETLLDVLTLSNRYHRAF